MNQSSYEFIELDGSLPFEINLHNVNYVPHHWHESVEIIFVLKGKVDY